MKGDKEISVFVDESGSYDLNANSSRFYIVCMVFHDQADLIGDEIDRLNEFLRNKKLPEDHPIHAGPLIRMEEPYRHMRRSERRAIFSALLAFLRRSNITYKCFSIDKRYIDSELTFHDALLQCLVSHLVARKDEFNHYDRIKIYYDNGQAAVTSILREAFAIYASKCEFVSKVTSSKYKLFQVADMICAIELARVKLLHIGHISDAEKDFFMGIGNFRKNYLKPILRKES